MELVEPDLSKPIDPPIFVIHETGIDDEPGNVTVHNDHGLILVIDGWFEMEQKFVTRSIPDSVTIIPAGVPHRPLAGRNLDYWLLGFSASGMGLDENQTFMRPFADVRRGGIPVFKIGEDRKQRLVYLFTLLQAELDQSTPESEDVVKSLLTLLLSEISRSEARAEIENSGSPLVTKALTFIEKNCLQPISLSDVANAIGRTAPHVATCVKQKTGFSVGRWIASARVAKAAQLLKHTDLNIDQIAPRVGWEDTTHFIRQFRKIYGITPAAWRRAQRS